MFWECMFSTKQKQINKVTVHLKHTFKLKPGSDLARVFSFLFVCGASFFSLASLSLKQHILHWLPYAWYTRMQFKPNALKSSSEKAMPYQQHTALSFDIFIILVYFNSNSDTTTAVLNCFIYLSVYLLHLSIKVHFCLYSKKNPNQTRAAIHFYVLFLLVAWTVEFVWHCSQFRKTAAWVTPNLSAVGILPSCLFLIASSGRKRKKELKYF